MKILNFFKYPILVQIITINFCLYANSNDNDYSENCKASFGASLIDRYIDEIGTESCDKFNNPMYQRKNDEERVSKHRQGLCKNKNNIPFEVLLEGSYSSEIVSALSRDEIDILKKVSINVFNYTSLVQACMEYKKLPSSILNKLAGSRLKGSTQTTKSSKNKYERTPEQIKKCELAIEPQVNCPNPDSESDLDKGQISKKTNTQYTDHSKSSAGRVIESEASSSGTLSR